MTVIQFSKWQGTGNDFIILDNRDGKVSGITEKSIEKLCDRRFGIGADGLMVLNNHKIYDFEMSYFNADGREAEMCGNGGRCMIGYANYLGIIKDDTRFMARDGIHEGKVLGNNNYLLKMVDLIAFRKLPDFYFLNTGVPHVVKFVDRIDKVNVFSEGRKIRNMQEFSPAGTNVNFVELSDNGIKMRTYERGVENETLSCGTGAVASAIAAYFESDKKATRISCKVPGGELKIKFTRTADGEFTNIFLEGQAKLVFEGQINPDEI